MSKVKQFYQKHHLAFLYFSFGIITTVASLSACFLTLRFGVLIFHDESGEPTELLDILGSTVQWVVGVLVAFFTNRKWVFKDAPRGMHEATKQLALFSGSRIATYFLEVIVNLLAIYAFERIGYIEISMLGMPITERFLAKLISSVLVVISNYFICKSLVFKTQNTSSKG